MLNIIKALSDENHIRALMMLYAGELCESYRDQKYNLDCCGKIKGKSYYVETS